MPNDFPRKDMHQMVTAEDVAKLEALSFPSNGVVTHRDHLGNVTTASREADLQGIVTRGHRALQGASTNLRESMADAAKHDFRHVVDIESIKAEMNDAAIGWRESMAEDI